MKKLLIFVSVQSIHQPEVKYVNINLKKKTCFFFLCESKQAPCCVQGSTKSSVGTAEGISEETDSKDDNLVFVAGATGKVGSRTVRYVY